MREMNHRDRENRGYHNRKPVFKFKIPKNTTIDYKNVPLLQKFVNERGKIVSQRVSGVTSKQQRQLCEAIKRARYLALLPTGGVKR
ncbi:MAG: 30S ribosomal protein S18 [Candidatus Omnitrophota bacterium]|nr:30S ribosomal protein S18 [Candidatus Omnitrophota bacterium]